MAEKPAQRTFGSIDDLAAAWNAEGREYYTELSARLTKLYETGSDVDLDIKDPRTRDMGDQVMHAIIERQGRGARELFDPAHTPLMGWIEQNDKDLPFVAILGPDELLVYRGRVWQRDGVAFHLQGDVATPVPDVYGIHRSRNRDHLVLAREAGLEIRDARAGLAGPAIATIAWPSLEILRPRGLPDSVGWERPEGRLEIEQLEISDDGMRVVVSCYRQGILLASRHAGEPPWSLLWPDVRLLREPPDEAPRAGDMTHVAISRDGTRLAFGSQDYGHFLAEIGAGGEPSWYATVGHVSEYPHHACFSWDGRHVALNSCHFYNGATVAFEWDGNRGAKLDSYEEHAQAPVIDGGLRVYAASWVDKVVLAAIVHHEVPVDGAFLLAGSGIFRICTATGALATAQGFGSSAGAVDFCPESRRLAISAYSGFVHVYDPYEEELPGRIDGYRPRRELARWILWEHLPAGPLRW